MAIQECRSSSLSVSEWCRQRGVATTTYYRWERELLTAAKPVSCSSVPAATFAELPEPKKMSRNVAKRFANVVLWGVRMTSAELKHQAKLQEWAHKSRIAAAVAHQCGRGADKRESTHRPITAGSGNC